MLWQHTFPSGHVEEPSVFWLVILPLRESFESWLRLSILRNNGSIPEVETILQNRTDEPGDGVSRVFRKSLFGSKNVTYWMGAIGETHDLREVTKQGNGTWILPPPFIKPVGHCMGCEIGTPWS